MQNDQKQIPESIWADGVPANIEEKDKINQQELLTMAVNYVVENCVVPKGFKIEQGYPQLNYPNVVMKRDGLLYAIVVIPSVYPNYVVPSNELRMQYVKQSKEQNITPLFAPVGYRSIDEDRAKASLVLKGDVFQTMFPGFIILNDEEQFDYNVKPENLFRP